MLKNSTEKFITVVSDEENPETKKVYIINKEFIVWAEVEG